MRKTGPLIGALAIALAVSVAPAHAQGAVTRDDVVQAALRRGTRVTLARTDSILAEASRVAARAIPNPTISATYSKSPPSSHLVVDLPFDAPWMRGPRVSAADSSRVAALARYAYERAAIRLEAEVSYAKAQSAEAHARLSRRTAQDADSLLVLARLRRDAGDASELDVEVAIVSAGQLANIAADDSLAFIGALLDVQRVMGLRSDVVQLSLADSLRPPADAGTAPGVATLPVLAASASVGAARENLRLERGTVFGVPALQLGIEGNDPDHPGILPLFGISIPLPLFDRRRGPIAQASAGLARAEAELELARRESDADIARATRERSVALERVRRDERLLASAARVSQMSLVAYREGAAALPSVLEAARNAREAFARYIDDLAAAGVADATLRWLTATMETR